jgi:hypothetical protein
MIWDKTDERFYPMVLSHDSFRMVKLWTNRSKEE